MWRRPKDSYTGLDVNWPVRWPAGVGSNGCEEGLSSLWRNFGRGPECEGSRQRPLTLFSLRRPATS